MRLKGTLPFLITEHYRRIQSCVMRWFHGTNDEYTSPIFFVLLRNVYWCEQNGAILKFFLLILYESNFKKFKRRMYITKKSKVQNLRS